jgi:HEAT repeat protein
MRAHSKRNFRILLAASGFLLAAPGVSPGRHFDDFAFWSNPQRDERVERTYERASKSLDQGKWDQALAGFDEVVRMKSPRADGALYWKAYSLNKLGRRDEALEALETLRGGYPQSRWLNDAKALDIEVRQAAGQTVSPEKAEDEDLKLMALTGLVHSDPDRAIPMLEKMLQGTESPKLKERALFVLAQSGSPRAKEIITGLARGSGNPDMQLKAIQYLGLFGGGESRQLLADLYASNPGKEAKRAILQGFMTSGDRQRLLAAAKGEQDAELRKHAIVLLGASGGRTELREMFQSEQSAGIRESILQALFVGGDTEKLLEVARSEKDPDVRRKAIHFLGVSGASRTGDTLVSIYQSEQDPSIRRQVIQGLFVQGNAKALVDLARKETDPSMKKDIVSKLALMRSKEATDYLTEILDKD